MRIEESTPESLLARQTLKELYEELRSFALEPSSAVGASPSRFGLVVLLRGGMSQWMATCLSASDMTKSPSMDVPNMTGRLTGSTPTQLTMVLGSIILSRCEGEAR